ncbi:MAG: murein L,D-transpeptidase [Clostridia bacterium]|nr:MAG: murein L,D-transpeptidase [Clostridia bacterium]
MAGLALGAGPGILAGGEVAVSLDPGPAGGDGDAGRPAAGGEPEPVRASSPVGDTGDTEPNRTPPWADPEGQEGLTAAPPASQDGQVSPTYLEANNIQPQEGLWIDVNISEQKVRIYEGDRLIKEMLASTGIEDKPTPLGSFKIQNRGGWFFNPKYQQGAKYWVSFKDWGVYLFHSLAMDENQEIIPEEAAKLGRPASHGCVRLEVENARWVYENVPEGTPVEIHE